MALGADEVVVEGLLNRLPNVGALVAGVCEEGPPNSGFDFSASDLVAAVVVVVVDGN